MPASGLLAGRWLDEIFAEPAADATSNKPFATLFEESVHLLSSLTEREREILQHLARGESNKTIARALDTSHDTVKLHVRHILTKLNLNSRVDAAVFAVEQRAAMPGGASLVESARRTPR